MREILFRAKTTKKENENHGFNNVWVYGDLLTNKGVHYIHPQNNVFRLDGELAKILIAHEVLSETIGQFTGLTDKNDVKIFEGDIVKWYSELVIVKFGEYDAIEQSYEIGNHFRKVDKFGWFGERQNCCSKGIEFILLKDGEVIGNIYDNPELLGE